MKAKKKNLKNETLRLNVVRVVFIFFAIVSISKLFSIQILQHNKYKAMAESQYINSMIIQAKRGGIISSDSFTLAGTQTEYLLYAEPQKIENKEEFADKLALILATAISPIASTDGSIKSSRDDIIKDYKENIFKNINQNLMWVGIQHNITPEEKDKIKKENIKGVGFQEESVRYYPENTLAAHVLGFVASNEKGEKQGYFGIEGNFDGDLKGKPGRLIEEKDALGSPILVGGYERISPINGRDIVLTINRSVQYIVEKKLKEAVETYGAASGSVIVMNPITSEIIAMANFPTFDPANFTEESNEKTDSNTRKSIEKRNLAIAETYEPGSVIKSFTISAAVDSNLINPSTTFNDQGPVDYSGHYIDNWDHKHWGMQTIVQLLEKSNNIGAAWVGHLVGPQRLYEYFKKFGLGEKTEIELEGEDTGLIRNYKDWKDIDLATAAFGQGISATPLQVLNGLNAIANNGILMKPKIVERINDSGKVIKIPNKTKSRVISKNTADTMTNMLISAVDEGESKYFNLKPYKIAGKTGTAQIFINGDYDSSKTNATFLGFLATSKKFSMIVRLNQPTTSVYAAETAVPTWMSIAKELVKYYGIPPDR